MSGGGSGMNQVPRILVLDVGNSRLKWAWGGGGRLEARGECLHGETDADPRKGAAQAWLRAPPWGGRRPARIAAVSVLGAAANRALAEVLEAHYRVPVQLYSARSEGWGVRNAYRRPERLGADRWAALVAARRRRPGTPLFVCDCGTAVTLDVLDAQGRHLGGLIAPGLGLMRQALAAGTADLPRLPVSAGTAGEEEGAELLACDTLRAMTAGTLEALAGTVERWCALARQVLVARGGGRESATGFITGGDAALVFSRLRSRASMPPSVQEPGASPDQAGEALQHVPELVLEGVLHMTEQPA